MPKLQIVNNNVKLSQPINYETLLELITEAPHINNITESVKKNLSGFMPAVYCKNNYRTTNNIIEYTGIFGFDLDLDKNSSSVNKYDLTIQQSENIKNDLNRLILILEENKKCFLICPSCSNCGIRILINTDIISENENEYKYYYEIIKSILQSIINEGLIELSNNKNNSNKYLYLFDQTNDPVRYFYYSHIDLENIVYEKDNILLKEKILKYASTNNIKAKINSFVYTGTTSNNNDFEAINKSNNEILERLKMLDNEDKKQLHKWLEVADNLHHGTGDNLFMIQKLNSFGRNYFYEIYKKYYTGGDNISTYGKFIAYVDNLKVKEQKNQKTLKGFFKGCGIAGLDSEIKFNKNLNTTDKVDFLDTPYDYNFSINRYITEANNNLKNELIQLINSKDLMIKSKPNTGKTTFIVDFINNNPDKKFIFITNKNILADKLYQSFINAGINEENLIRMFGNHRKLDKNKTGNIYFSSIQGLNNSYFDNIKFDYCIIDEAHLLVDFIELYENKEVFSYKGFQSKDIDGLYKIINDKTIRKIYISATPEYFSLLKNVYDFNYINIECKNIKPKLLNIIIDKSPKKKILELYSKYIIKYPVDIYINDCKKLQGLKFETDINKKDLNEGAILFTSKEQNNPEIKKIIDTEYLPSGKTMLTTSYGQEGLNFLNEEKRILLIAANDNTDFKDIYQYINRYRKGNIEIFVIMSSLNRFIKIKDIDNNITYQPDLTINKPVFNENEITDKFNDMRKLIIEHKETFNYFGSRFTSSGDENYFQDIKDYKMIYLEYLNKTEIVEKKKYILQFFNFKIDYTEKNEEKGEAKFTNYKDLNTLYFQNLFLNYIELWKHLDIQNDKTFDLSTFIEFSKNNTNDFYNVLKGFEKYSKELFYVLNNLYKINSLEKKYNSNDYIFKNPQIFKNDFYFLHIQELINNTYIQKISSSEKKIMNAHKIKDENFINLYSKEFKEIKEQILIKKSFDIKKNMNYIDMIDLRNIIKLKKHLKPEKEIDFIISITKKLLNGEIKKIMSNKVRINRLYFQV